MKLLGMEIRWPKQPRSCTYNPKDVADPEIPWGPHCDPNIVHAPSVCAFCDECLEAQVYRIHHGINFTGQYEPNRAPCPAEQLRSLETIECWPGNRPTKKEA